MERNENTKKLVVIGGGTAGWISAIFAFQKLNSEVTIVSPSSIDILGAGEGSTPNMPDLFQDLGINIKDFLTKTDATIKTGIHFINWDKNVSGDFDHSFDGNNGFHFNARKTADYLESYGINLGIKKIDSIVDQFIEDTKGNIVRIIFNNGLELSCDFVFDCSGFQRLVIGKHFKSEWKSYSNYLICNKAFGFFLPQEEDIDERSLTKTRAISMNYGWMWQIPLQNRWGCGYVFNDDFIGIEKAISEVEKSIGTKIEVQKIFEFNPGVYKKTWVRNCVALGLSSGFIEPLEATSIMTLIASLSRILKCDVFNAKKSSRDKYNSDIVSISNQIVNFLVNHYKCGRTDTPFWKKIDEMEIPYELKMIKEYQKLDIDKIRESFGIDTKDPVVFGEKSYRTVDIGHLGKKKKKSLI